MTFSSLMFLWIILLKKCACRKSESGMYIVSYSLTNHYNFIESKYKWAGLISWYNMWVPDNRP